jgi:DNA-binding GntR family transcriptional regulator
VNSEQVRPPLAAVRERVREQLRERIVTGVLRPGDRLVERDLAEDLGVSRIPVREAIRSLEADGFVVVQSPRRVVVRQLSRLDVEELFDVREALEVLASGLACQRVDPPALHRLKRSVTEAARARAAGNITQMAEANVRFHQEIVTLAGNRLLLSMLHQIEDRLRWLFRQNEDWDRLLHEHRRLYEAIASGDPERARAYSAEHVRDNRALVLGLLFPDESDTGDERRASASSDLRVDSGR